MKWMSKRTLAVMMAGALAIGSFTTGNISTAASKTGISRKKLTMRVGDSQNLSLKKTKKATAKKAKWASSNKKIVKVSFKKKTTKATVTAVSEGKATVTATLNKKSYTSKVTVKPATQNLLMLRDTFVTYVGTAIGVRPVVVGDEALDMTQLSYKSSDPDVARIVGNEGAVEGVKTGSATITITNPDGKKLEAKVLVFGSESEATYVNDFYEKVKEDKLAELREAGITVAEGQQFSGYNKQVEDTRIKVREFSDSYLNAVKNNGGKSVYADNTPADDIACIRSVFDYDEATKKSILTQDIKSYLEPLDKAATVQDVMKLNAEYVSGGESGFWSTEMTITPSEIPGVPIESRVPIIKLDLKPASMLSSYKDYENKDSELYKALIKVVEETLRISGESEEDISKHTPLLMELFESFTPKLTFLDVQPQLAGMTPEEAAEFISENGLEEVVLTVGQGDIKYPEIQIGSTYKAAGFEDSTSIISEMQSGSWNQLNELIKNNKMDELKVLLRFCFAYNFISYTESGYKAQQIYTSLKSGMINLPSDEMITKNYNNMFISVLTNMIGWDTAKEYSKVVLGDKTKQGIQNIIDRVLAEYKDTFNACEWISPEGRAGAIKKIDNMKTVVYYPDIDTYDLKLDLQTAGEGGTLFKNLDTIHKGILQNYAAIDGKKINGPDLLWFSNQTLGVTPMSANAVYTKFANCFFIMAGIVGEETYKEGDDAYNIGRMGYVSGHEIGHAFDSEGCKYDENGENNAWMTAADVEVFNSKQAKCIKQFDQFTAYYDKVNKQIYYANGTLELTENMADISSIEVVTRMFKKNGADKENLKKLFINMSQFWMSASYDPSMLNLDIHAPDILRGGYVFVNFQDFYDAFDIKEGDGMYLDPEYRMTLWS